MCVPEELSDMSDAEQMLIARLAPTLHVHMLKHGGIASRGHCNAFPKECKNQLPFCLVYQQKWISYV